MHSTLASGARKRLEAWRCSPRDGSYANINVHVPPPQDTDLHQTAEMGGVVGKEKEGIEIFVTGREGKQLCQGLGHFCMPATKEQQQGLSLGPAMNSIEPQMCRCSHFPDISNPLNRI